MLRRLLALALLVSACGGDDTTPVPSGRVEGPPLGASGDIRTHAAFPSGFVPARDVTVWLPPGYAARDTLARHPVVYVLDGEQAFDPSTASGGVDWGLDEWMGRLITDGEARPTIVVAIAATDRRREEYFPAKAAREPGPIAAGVAGEPPIGPALESDAHLLFLVQELKPFIDRTYRTLPGRPDTFVMGAGLGGLFALYAMAEFPDVFGGAVALAPRWSAGEGAVLEYLETALPDAASHRLYLDHGTPGPRAPGTMGPAAAGAALQVRADSLLRARGFEDGRTLLSRVVDGADDSPRTIRTRVQHPLRFLLSR